MLFYKHDFRKKKNKKRKRPEIRKSEIRFLIGIKFTTFAEGIIIVCIDGPPLCKRRIVFIYIRILQSLDYRPVGPVDDRCI